MTRRQLLSFRKISWKKEEGSKVLQKTYGIYVDSIYYTCVRVTFFSLFSFHFMGNDSVIIYYVSRLIIKVYIIMWMCVVGRVLFVVFLSF